MCIDQLADSKMIWNIAFASALSVVLTNPIQSDLPCPALPCPALPWPDYLLLISRVQMRHMVGMQGGASSVFPHAGGRNPCTDLLLKHLQLPSANSRIVAALLTSAWIKASQQSQAQGVAADQPDQATTATQPDQATTAPAEALPGPGFPLQELVPALAAVLATPAVVPLGDGSLQPFSELSSLYALMRQHAQVCPSMCACVCHCHLLPFLLY